MGPLPFYLLYQVHQRSVFIKSPTKRLFLGCVISPLAAEAQSTQPMKVLLVGICKVNQGKIPPTSGTETVLVLRCDSRSLSSLTLFLLRMLQGNGFLLKRNSTSMVNMQVEKANLHREKLQ